MGWGADKSCHDKSSKSLPRTSGRHLGARIQIATLEMRLLLALMLLGLGYEYGLVGSGKYPKRTSVRAQ